MDCAFFSAHSRHEFYRQRESTNSVTVVYYSICRLCFEIVAFRFTRWFYSIRRFHLLTVVLSHSLVSSNELQILSSLSMLCFFSSSTLFIHPDTQCEYFLWMYFIFRTLLLKLTVDTGKGSANVSEKENAQQENVKKNCHHRNSTDSFLPNEVSFFFRGVVRAAIQSIYICYVGCYKRTKR